MDYDFVSIAQALRQTADALSGLAQTLAGLSDVGQTPPMAVDQPALASEPSLMFTPPSTTIKQDDAPAPYRREPGRPGIRIEDNVEDLKPTTPPAPTEHDVRDALTALCKAGRSEAVKATLSHYGATTLSEVETRFYRDLLAEARALTHSTHPTTTKEAT